jgi:hypothetical protein
MTVEELIDVRVMHMPMRLFEQSRRHMEELTREFEFIAKDDQQAAPARLLALVERLNARSGDLADAAEARLEDASKRGEDFVDLVYRVPPAARAACEELNAMLDEADNFCRQGELLTLATPPDQVAFRRWFMGEFISQLANGAPTPWKAMSDASS